jgi:hypothetical protein
MSFRTPRERRQLIEDYRKDHHAETLGLDDTAVEVLCWGLDAISTEALARALAQRGYLVSLEVG